MPDGNILIADGHWPRPSNAQQDGDRLVVVTPDGEFVRSVGSMGAGPGEFMGPQLWQLMLRVVCLLAIDLTIGCRYSIRI
ncbi:MAG: hypothetical protein Ct9H300mP22_7350 [Gammaproteobacteria bacterium]|nr:MAG: hypothetical protein Ct9H300mP22_7350 [Gammaproteobacteria bacterium]